ncbi:MAG: response regulator [Gemmatimonadetes bacterium]|nr:response regulator [Gemmatimonadota bacterium]NIQ57101.1 response regulator [Gemmatimonadota bacterium]NIU77268.1 response regulator [Gammaproteobacteria bacterium]NIX46542.1 response regulator [Gemmatimonadota bacterium]NIY10860.1 response regulator [Gemmatimonadota bacterium]
MTEAQGPGERAERIVVIDDDYAMRLSCRQILTKSGFEVETYEDGSRGLAGVAESKPSIVVVDLKMPGLSGMDVIRRVREIDPEVVLIVITGYATVGTAVEAMKTGAYDFLPKPFKPDELRMIVGRALERRRLLQRSRELELERELMKRRFVSFVSHQLKSPLAAVHQYLEVLQKLEHTPEMEGKRGEWLARCLARAAEMRSLIDDWLTLARAEGSCLVAVRERVDVRPILERLAQSHEELAAERDVTLSVALPSRPFPVIGDPNCLMVLFDNLLTNAISYNRAGGTVTVEASESAGEVVVEVRDTGLGIPEESLDRLFEEFYRVRRGNGGSDPEPGRPRGTGLGLPICRRIVAELGGGIEVESKLGAGSTFRVRLPGYQEAAPGPDAGAVNERASTDDLDRR